MQSLLWGSGGWTLTRGLLRRLEAVDMSFLRRVPLQLLRRDGRALKAKRGWAGHLARAPPSSPLGRLLRFRSLTWWKEAQDSLPKLDRHNHLRWRHSRSGRFLQWEHALHRYDEHWLYLAFDRETWEKASTFFVPCELQHLNGRGLVSKRTADELGDSEADIRTLCIRADQTSPLAALASHTLLRKPLVTYPCNFSMNCLCDSSHTVSQALGRQPATSTSCQLMRNRTTRSLASIAHRTRQTHSDILGHLTSSATHLAQFAIRQGSSSECWLANAFQVTRKSCVSIRALCSSFSDSHNTGLGIVLAVKSSAQWVRVYEGSVLLGTFEVPEVLGCIRVWSLCSHLPLLSPLFSPRTCG